MAMNNNSVYNATGVLRDCYAIPKKSCMFIGNILHYMVF